MEKHLTSLVLPILTFFTYIVLLLNSLLGLMFVYSWLAKGDHFSLSGLPTATRTALEVTTYPSVLLEKLGWVQGLLSVVCLFVALGVFASFRRLESYFNLNQLDRFKQLRLVAEDGRKVSFTECDKRKSYFVFYWFDGEPQVWHPNERLNALIRGNPAEIGIVTWNSALSCFDELRIDPRATSLWYNIIVEIKPSLSKSILTNAASASAGDAAADIVEGAGAIAELVASETVSDEAEEVAKKIFGPDMFAGSYIALAYGDTSKKTAFRVFAEYRLNGLYPKQDDIPEETHNKIKATLGALAAFGLKELDIPRSLDDGGTAKTTFSDIYNELHLSVDQSVMTELDGRRTGQRHFRISPNGHLYDFNPNRRLTSLFREYGTRVCFGIALGLTAALGTLQFEEVSAFESQPKPNASLGVEPRQQPVLEISTGGSRLNIRLRPSTDSPIVGKLSSGTTVWLCETRGNWGNVETEGIRGWIYLEHTSEQRMRVPVGAAVAPCEQ